MISQPTTDQILEDCAREVRDGLLAVVADPALRVRLEMLEQVLKACAVRAAHEIAWMSDERADMTEFAGEVAAAHPEGDDLAALVQAYRGACATTTNLDLKDQARLYDLAGRAFSAAVARSFAQGDRRLVERARALVQARCAHEAELRVGFRFPGRT